MKAIVVALLAVLPLACLGELGPDSPLQFKTVYYESSGPNDKCDKVPNELMEQPAGNELSAFDCAGKQEGDQMCICMAGNMNGETQGFVNMCGKCSMTHIPDEGFEETYQLAGFADVYTNLINKLIEGQEITEDDLHTHGATHNVNIPIIPAKSMVEYALFQQSAIGSAPDVADEDRQLLLGKMKEAFDIYTGNDGNPGEKLKKMLKKFGMVIPKAMEKLGCENIDFESDKFKLKFKSVMGKLLPQILSMKTGQ